MTASETHDQVGLPRLWGGVLVAVGVACGLAAHLIMDRAESEAWQVGPTLALLIGGLAFCLAVDPRRWLAAALAAVGFALLLGLLVTTAALRYGPDLGDAPGILGAGLLFETLIVAQIAVPFFQTGQERWRLSFPYERLFANAWNNSLIVALSAAFAGLFWGILWLFAKLFDLVGVDLLQKLIEEPAFAWPATTAAVALGIYAGRDYRGVVVALRRVVFSLFSVLTPLYLLLSLGFILALAFGGFDRLTTVVSAAATLVTLLIVGVVLINAVLRDGSGDAEAGRLLTLCAVLLAPALLVFAGFAAFAIFLRIDQYGLTPERIWIAVTAAVLCLHALAYGGALATGRRWMTVSRQANVAIAVVIVLTALALLTPWGSPSRLSAESQYQRLVSGAVDPAEFDYGFLKFDLGKAGTEVLARIAEDSGAADPAVVAEQLADLASVRDRWQWQLSRLQESLQLNVRDILVDPLRVQRVPPDLTLPEELATGSWIRPSKLLEDCGQQNGKDCLVTAVDLTDRPGSEYLLATKSGEMLRLSLLDYLEERGWQTIPLIVEPHGDALWEALLKQDIEAVPPIHRDLRVGEEIIRLQLPELLQRATPED